MGLMDFLNKEVSGSSYERDDYGTLNPEQKKMFQTWAPEVTKMAGKELPMYGKSWEDYSTPLTSGEWDAISRNARLSALGEQGLGPLLKGEFPEQYYRDTLYQPALKNWQEDILPVLNESYAGPSGGGYWGTARANAAGKSARDLTDTLAAKRAELAWNVQQNVPNAIAAANALTQTEAQAQQTPRLVQQFGLEKLYNEWVRTRPENSPYLKAALDFLNLSTVTNTYDPASEANTERYWKNQMLGNWMSFAPSLSGFTNTLSAYKGGSTGSKDESPETPKSGSYSLTNPYASSYTPQYYSQAEGGLGAANNSYQQSALGAMDWKNTGNYQSLGGFNY